MMQLFLCVQRLYELYTELLTIEDNNIIQLNLHPRRAAIFPA